MWFVGALGTREGVRLQEGEPLSLFLSLSVSLIFYLSVLGEVQGGMVAVLCGVEVLHVGHSTI